VNVTSHTFKLQFTSMVMYKEMFCVVGHVNSKKGINCFGSF
jgi:hypothetical protein